MPGVRTMALRLPYGESGVLSTLKSTAGEVPLSSVDRYENGLARFREVFGRDPLPTMNPNPDFSKITIEHLFGEIWTRPNLSLHERELVTISALAMVRAERELRGHMQAALQLGIPIAKIAEAMIHL